MNPCMNDSNYKMVLVKAMCDEALKIKDSKEATAEIFKDVRKEIKVASAAVCESLSSSARILIHPKKLLSELQQLESLRVKLVFYSGMKLDQGYISSCFLTNKKKKICFFDDPSIFIFEKKLSDVDVVMDILKTATNKKVHRPVLIIAEDFENDVLDTLIKTKLITRAKICAIKGPGYGEARNAVMKELLNVLSVVTEMDCTGWRGCCDAVMVSENDTILLHKSYTKKEIEKEISKELRSKPKSIPDKDWLYAILKACLSGTVHQVICGGIAFLNASKELDKLQIMTSAQKIAIQIIKNALKMPLHAIASTAGVEGSDVVSELLDRDNPDLGYDATTGEFVDMIKCGNVDPSKLVIKAFVKAISMFLKNLREGKLKVRGKTRSFCWDRWNFHAGTIQGKAM